MSERRLTKTAQLYLGKSDKERIEYCNRSHWIGYKAALTLIELLQDKFDEPPQLRHEGLLIYGDHNNGKTAILKKFYELHKTSLEKVNEEGEHVYEIPVIYLQAPTQPDEGRLYSLILDELCVPHRSNEKVMEKARLVDHYLKKLNTRMILVDEIHSALKGNLNKQRTFIDILKQLSNKLSLSIILAGTREAHSALSSSDEVNSRFPSIELPRWGNDKKFRSFIATYETCLPLKETSDIVHDPQIIDALYNQSDGLIGKAVNLLKKSAIKAIKSGREKIIVDDIEYLPKL
jgi:replication-associated recombination protein RarA